jgi:hypothetical protein
MDAKQSLETLPAGFQAESGHSFKLVCLLASQHSLEGDFSSSECGKFSGNFFQDVACSRKVKKFSRFLKRIFWLILQRLLSAGKLQGR